MRVLARDRQHLDEAVRLAVGDGAVQIIDAVARDLERDALFRSLSLVQSDARDLGLDECCLWNHAIVGTKLLEWIKERIDCRIPGLV